MYVLLTNLQTASHIACMLSSPKSPEPTWRVLVCFMLPFGGQPTQKILFRTTPHDALSLEVLKTRAGPGLSCVQAPTANIGQPIRTYTATYAVCHAAFDRMTLESMGDCGGRHARFWFPRCKARARDAWHKAVCISETDLRRFTQDFTILLLFYHDPSRLHLGNRPAPVHPGFYYFTILLLFYHDPSRCISETDLRRFTQDFTILLFCYFTISVLYYSTMYYFTVNYSNIYYSTTTPAVCISLTTFTGCTIKFASRKPSCAC